MPLQATSGAASYDAFGGGVAAVPNYIEECFSTTLYTGNGSTQTITNGIDLAGKGGLVWAKSRSVAAQHVLADTARGTGQILQTSTINGNTATALNITSFNADGYGLSSYSGSNGSGITYASWTFRKQPKFFDVVTYTGTGAARTIAHNLGSAPGCIIVKQTSAASNWMVYHQGLTSAQYVLNLNNTGPQSAQTSVWNSTAPTSTVFSVGSDLAVNDIGATYVAYLFAHNAGGFGLSGTDNVISCGSFTTDASQNASVNLGYEPQWLLAKRYDGVGGWGITDTMRGWNLSTADAVLIPNLSDAETSTSRGNPTATGFDFRGVASASYIYIAIRRGPMKVPTDGTKVFSPIARTGTGAAATVTGLSFPPDMALTKRRNGATASVLLDRLRGAPVALRTSSTAAEVSDSTFATSFNMNGITFGNEVGVNGSTFTYANWFFGRAPGFFDEVCYTGTGSATTVTHNLAAVPELMIVKSRSAAGFDWVVYAQPQGNTKAGYLNDSQAFFTFAGAWNNTSPTSTVFTLGNTDRTNYNGATFVAYLFATCPGVSKVFSFTGNGSTQTINCGFTGGARFVLLKASSATGGWFTYDTARGMTVLTDPYLQLNSTAAETATLGSVTTVSTGFAVNEAITTGVNTNGVTYIGLAIA